MTVLQNEIAAEKRLDFSPLGIPLRRPILGSWISKRPDEEEVVATLLRNSRQCPRVRFPVMFGNTVKTSSIHDDLKLSFKLTRLVTEVHGKISKSLFSILMTLSGRPDG